MRVGFGKQKEVCGYVSGFCYANAAGAIPEAAMSVTIIFSLHTMGPVPLQMKMASRTCAGHRHCEFPTGDVHFGLRCCTKAISGLADGCTLEMGLLS
jgi:hypothetical protein